MAEPNAAMPTARNSSAAYDVMAEFSLVAPIDFGDAKLPGGVLDAIADE